MNSNLPELAEEKRIRYFLISFSDLFGVVRSKLVPAHAIGQMAKEGAGFAGFASYLDLSPADADMFVLPEAERVIQLPWKPEVAWLPGDIYLDGGTVEHSPAATLKRVLDKAHVAGYALRSGVECEYYLLDEYGENLADNKDKNAKPCYDQQALMRRYDLVSQICDYMHQLGWQPYQNDHEDANGQFEMNWGYADPLVTADRHTFFKFMVKTLAEQSGLRATFMPKPKENLTGNGCHTHVSVWDTSAKTNLMENPDGELGLSDLAYNFIGGVLKHASSAVLMTNPVVNSYKRINAQSTYSGATWSPNSVTYSGNNRTHLIRIPESNRIEVRIADGAANPYLLQASIAATGLHGVQNRINPGKRLDINMFTHGYKIRNAPKLPTNMLDAIYAFEKNKILPDILGKDFCLAFAKLKREEWNAYMRHFSTWEVENAIDV